MNRLATAWIAYARGEPSGLRWVSWPLRIAAHVFWIASTGRWKGYQRGWLSSVRFPVPTISVGNITVGGTGKTPCTVWLAHTLIQGGRKPGIVLRGYGAKVPAPRVVRADGPGGEEARLLAELLPEVAVIESPARWLGARCAVVEHECDTIILDDGFQHAAIQRNLDMVLVDASCPWGNGTLLPAGLLREPIGFLSRANVIVLTRADTVDAETEEALSVEMRRVAPQALLATAAHCPTGLRRLTDNHPSGLSELVGRRVGLCSAIGNPEAFKRTVRDLRMETIGHAVFRDHHHYTRRDVEEILARFQGAEMILCTSKDAIKLRPLLEETTGKKLWSLEVEWRFLSGEEAVRERIREEARNA